MNNVSWGTREVTERKSPEQMAAEKLEAEEAAKKKAMKKSLLGELFNTHYFLNLNLIIKCISLL